MRRSPRPLGSIPREHAESMLRGLMKELPGVTDLYMRANVEHVIAMVKAMGGLE